MRENRIYSNLKLFCCRYIKKLPFCCINMVQIVIFINYRVILVLTNLLSQPDQNLNIVFAYRLNLCIYNKCHSQYKLTYAKSK